MVQRKPDDSIKVQQVLKLVDELEPAEREEVLYQLKLAELRREIEKGLDSADRGDLHSEEEVMAFLDQHHKQRIERQKK